MFPHLSYLRQCFTIMAILMVFSATLFAQVTIKEKVTINPHVKSSRGIDQIICPAGNLFSSFSGVVMSKKGALIIAYDYAQRLGDYIPTSATSAVLARRFRGNVAAVDSFVSFYFNSLTPYTRNDPSCSPQYINQYSYSQQGVLVQPTYTLFTVQQGDSVQFLYTTDRYPVNGSIDTLFLHSYDYDSTFHRWDIWFGSCDNCRSTWSEMLNVSVSVVDTTVTFTPPASNNVYPTYPGHNNTLATKDTLDLELQVNFLDTLRRNVWIRVDTTVLVDSGGHSHYAGRPHGRYLVPRTSPPAGYDTLTTFTRQTDSTGTIKFKFLASQFGGIEKIRAVRLGDTTSFDTLRLWTVVKGLSPLVDNSTKFDLVGGTCGHKGPGGPVGCQTPDNNHYAAKIVRDSLPLMASTWVDSFKQTMLFINDISLPYGGLFDVDTNWRPEHKEHREGLDVDLRTEIPSVRSGVKVRNAQGKWIGNDKFEKLCKESGVKKPDGHKKGTSREHYHLNY